MLNPVRPWQITGESSEAMTSRGPVSQRTLRVLLTACSNCTTLVKKSVAVSLQVSAGGEDLISEKEILNGTSAVRRQRTLPADLSAVANFYSKGNLGVGQIQRVQGPAPSSEQITRVA